MTEAFPRAAIMLVTEPITVNYGQVLANLANIDRPGLIWNDQNTAQGFAYNPGIASFAVPDHDGNCLLEVDLDADAAHLQTEASLWSIEVPFDATETQVEVGTVLDDRPFGIALGPHRLVFEAHPQRVADGVTYTYVLRFLFIKSDQQTFAILKQGSLSSGTVLTITAERA